MTDKTLNMLIGLKKISEVAVDLPDEATAFALAQRIADRIRRSVTICDEDRRPLATFHPSSIDSH